MGTATLRASARAVEMTATLARLFYILCDPTTSTMLRSARVALMTKQKAAVKAARIQELTDNNTRSALVEMADALRIAMHPKMNKTAIASLIAEREINDATPEPTPETTPEPTSEPTATAARPSKAPIARFVGGAQNGNTWTKVNRGPWPQTASAETGLPVTPAEAVRLLVESPNGVYVHVTDPGTGEHMFMHSDLMTAWRALNPVTAE